MINRRILRIKAMQCLYSYRRNKESNYHVALAELQEAFNMEMMEVGKDHAEEYTEREIKATEVLADAVLQKKESPETIGEEFDDKTVQNVFNDYNSRNQKDYYTHRKRMVVEAEGVYDQYLSLLKLLFDFARVDTEQLLEGNEVLECIEKGQALQNILKNKAVQWDQALVKQWYRALMKEEALVALLKNNRGSFEQYRKSLRSFIIDFIFKNEHIVKQLEENDINWEENRDVLKNMLNNTVKMTESDNCEKAELYLLSRNWEDDREFFVQLFEEAAGNESFFQEVISGKSKKWAVDRIALVDKVLIELAITEMLGFPSIPVKVSINEYIEISKVYSTPKSWQFVNGMLDEIAKTLRNDGKIKKSGRGLMDNK